jgi:tRNA pseudouridine32 synthase / 23S rRNA pseudouridine746 synthase
MHIIYHDEHLLVVNKPAGLLSVPGRLPEHKDCVITQLQIRYPDALTVHRLDQVTSGVMVFACSKFVQSRLSYQFAKRQISKRYEAMVEGVLKDERGEINAPMSSDWPNRPRQKIDPENGKPALTRWHVLSRDERKQTTHLALEPFTGRTHQLRVHLASIGHPIVGDVLYGAQAAQRVYLHATRLRFAHPTTKIPLHFDAVADF